MKVRELLRLLLWPLIAASALFIALTFIFHFVQGMSAPLDYLLGIIDLREERTFGTWFESILFVATGLSFFLLSRHPRLPSIGKILFVLMALGFCFLSADESMALHEFMGYEFEQATGLVDDTALDQRGYSWVLLYAPAALVLFGLVVGFYRRMLKGASSPAASICFCLAWAGAFLVLLMEAVEGWSVFARVESLGVLTCFEESFEMATLLLFYGANLLIAEESGL